jgi:hypothetical protein
MPDDRPLRVAGEQLVGLLDAFATWIHRVG